MKQTKTIFSTFAIAFLLVVGLAYAVTTNFDPPTACAGGWTSCSNANADDANRATATPTASTNVTGNWTNYGFSLPAGSVVDSVVVRADFYASNVRGYANVQVSNDGGTTYGPAHIIGGNTAEQTYLIDVTSDFAWTSTMLSNSNFKVKVTAHKVGSGSNPTTRLDWIPVEVNYTEFDFNVSTSPTSDTVALGGSTSTTVDVTYLAGNAVTTSLSYSNCPGTCYFGTSSGTPTFSTTLYVNNTNQTGTFNINVNGIGGGKLRTAVYQLTVV